MNNFSHFLLSTAVTGLFVLLCPFYKAWTRESKLSLKKGLDKIQSGLLMYLFFTFWYPLAAGISCSQVKEAICSNRPSCRYKREIRARKVKRELAVPFESMSHFLCSFPKSSNSLSLLQKSFIFMMQFLRLRNFPSHPFIPRPSQLSSLVS